MNKTIKGINEGFRDVFIKFFNGKMVDIYIFQITEGEKMDLLDKLELKNNKSQIKLLEKIIDDLENIEKQNDEIGDMVHCTCLPFAIGKFKTQLKELKNYEK